ncbi:MAG: ChbG/HpnK family deacetylase, partial [Pseudobdellovibrionaceae bacterium]
MKLSPNFVFNADDAGLSLTMSKDLLDQVQEGSLNGISVLMNGESVKWLKEALQASQTEQIQIKLHLNLSDGKSLTSPEKIPMLVNANGHFRYTFVSLFFRYCFSSTRARRLLSEQIEMEIKSQLKAFSDTFSGKIRVDGHNHIHMLPFVFSTLLKTNNLFPLYFVRIPQEKFLFSYFRPFRIRIANLLKFVLLNSLSRLFNYRARLSRGGIRSNRFFFG